MTGQDGHSTGRRGTAAVTAVAVLVAGTLLSAVGVAALGPDPAEADTVLLQAAGAEVVLADGTRRPAVEGQAVPDGATVELPGQGSAVLRAGDRETYLARASAVQVVDGVRQVLRRGTAFVDAADAARLELMTDSGVVTVREGALVRVDGGSVPRVGVLRSDDEDGADVRAAGRRTATTLPPLRQVQVPRGGLPGSVAPLRLTPGDSLEMRLAAGLVDADRYLNTTGDTLRRSPGQAGIVAVAMVEQAPSLPLDREGGIAFLVALAADRGGLERVPEVLGLREQGGSWGVVAAIVGATVDEVGARLDGLLAGSLVALPAAPALPVDGPDLLDVLDVGQPPTAPVPGAAPQPTPRPTPGPVGPAGPPAGPGAPGAPSPTPTPTTAPEAVGTVTETVGGVVDAVLDLIDPSPSAAPVPVPVPTPPLPVPSRSPQPLIDLDVDLELG